MTPARFGDPKAAIDIPVKNNNMPNSQYAKLTGRVSRSAKQIAVPSIPPDANGRAPKWSERYPLRGPEISMPTVRGTIATPAHRGVRAKLAVQGQPYAL